MKKNTFKLCIAILCILGAIANIYHRVIHQGSNESTELIINMDLYLILVGVLIYLLPIEEIKKISGSNWIVELKETIQKQQKKSEDSLEEQKNLLFHFLRLTLDHRKVQHLKNLQTTQKYNKTAELEKELRDLRLAKYIRLKSNTEYISQLPNSFILSEHFILTDEGNDCINWLNKHKMDESDFI